MTSPLRTVQSSLVLPAVALPAGTARWHRAPPPSYFPVCGSGGSRWLCGGITQWWCFHHRLVSLSNTSTGFLRAAVGHATASFFLEAEPHSTVWVDVVRRPPCTLGSPPPSGCCGQGRHEQLPVVGAPGRVGGLQAPTLKEGAAPRCHFKGGFGVKRGSQAFEAKTDLVSNAGF